MFLKLLLMKRISPTETEYAGDDRHGTKYRVTEIFLGASGHSLWLINPGLGSAHLHCGASPLSFKTQYRNR